MTAVIANVLWPLGAAAFLGASVALATGRAHAWKMLGALGCGLLAAECALEGSWFGAGWNAVLAAVLLGWDWWNRRGRKVAKLIGEKSRAVLAAVVERAREAGTRSPVPQGAGA